jgi:hypothetical protein
MKLRSKKTRKTGASSGQQHQEPRFFLQRRRAHASAKKSNLGEANYLQQTHGKRLDTGTTSSAGSSDTALETVGVLSGAANGGR